MHLCLFEDRKIEHLKPLVWTRPVFDLRLGMRTLLETSRDAFAPEETHLHVRPLLSDVTAKDYDNAVNRLPGDADILFVNGRYVAEEGALLDRLRAAADPKEPGRVFLQGEDVVAAWVPASASLDSFGAAPGGALDIRRTALSRETFDGLSEERVDGATMIGRLWHLLDALHPALLRDFKVRTADGGSGHSAGSVHSATTLVHPEEIYIAPSAEVAAGAILRAGDGPIYVDEDAEIQEQAVIKGPAYIGRRTQVKVGAVIEGSAFGYYVKVAGEVEDTVIHSLSNKAHPGFLGSSYLGRWCNLGADTNNSNLKNDYGTVTVYDPVEEDFVSTGRQFAGLFMGDHSKCSINTMFNTGTVVGVFCNIFGAGFPPRHIPSFSWGGAEGMMEYRLDKALQVAEAVMARRDAPYTEADWKLLAHIYEMAHEK